MKMRFFIVNKYIKEFFSNDVGLDQEFNIVLIKTDSGYKKISDLTTTDYIISEDKLINVFDVKNDSVSSSVLNLYYGLVQPEKEKIKNGIFKNSISFYTELEIEKCNEVYLKINDKEYIGTFEN